MLVPVNRQAMASPVVKDYRSATLVGGAQMTGRFDYDTNFIDMNMYVKNLKANSIELNERIYVDKPLRR